MSVWIESKPRFHAIQLFPLSPRANHFIPHFPACLCVCVCLSETVLLKAKFKCLSSNAPCLHEYLFSRSSSSSRSSGNKKNKHNANKKCKFVANIVHILIEQTGQMKMNLDACKTFSFIRNSKFIHNLLRVCMYACARIFTYTPRAIATEMSMICHVATLSVFNATILCSIQYAHCNSLSISLLLSLILWRSLPLFHTNRFVACTLSLGQHNTVANK